MTTTVEGPSGTAAWQEGPAGTDKANGGAGFLLLPDAANDARATSGGAPRYYFLPAAPRLGVGPAGDPVLSLTLVLERQPTPDEASVTPLIVQGVLSFEAALSGEPPRIDAAGGSAGTEYRPLFAREAVFSLSREGQSAPLATVRAAGSGAHAALSVTLGRDDTIDVLAALRGEASDLFVRADVTYSAVGGDRLLRLYGSWAAIYDYLEARLRSGEPLTHAALGEQFAALLRDDILTVYQTVGGREEVVEEPDPAPLFPLFLRLSPVILNRETPERAGADVENRYTLRARPHPMFQLDYEQRVTAPGEKQRTVAAPLDRVLQGALEGRDWEPYVHLVCPRGGSERGGGFGPPARRVESRGTVPRAARSVGAIPRGVSLAVTDSGVRSVAAALRPDSAARPAVSALIASEAVTPFVVQGRIRHWWLDDLVLDKGAAQPRQLPTVTDPDAPLWVDRRDPGTVWYAPDWELVTPAQSDDPETAPFRFDFERTGVTAAGQPALRAAVRFTLRSRMSDATRTALEARGNPVARPLPASDIDVRLEIPFVEAADGRLRSDRFPARVEQTGDVVIATVELLNDWVRLCYGALSAPGFQAQPARVVIAYSYEAYVPVREEDIKVAFGGKASVTPMVFSQLEVRRDAAEPYFDATDATFISPVGELRLRREAPTEPAGADGADGAGRAGTRAEPVGVGVSGASSGSPVSPVSRAMRSGPALAAAALRPGVLTAPIRTRPNPAVLAARPEIKPLAGLNELVRQTKYAAQTLFRQEVKDALVPCAGWGAFYRETDAAGTRSIGCRDALQLGRTAYRQYEEMPDLRDDLFRVYRSLQQPDRFLVVPAAYRITRYSPAVPGKAYRPCIIVYSVIDVDTPENNRVLFDMTLDPDIPAHARRTLQGRLEAHARDPVIEYPTELPGTTDTSWTIGVGSTSFVTVTTVKAPEFFRVTLATDLSSALLVRDILRNSGVAGSVRFTLPDGSVLQSGLALELGGITGPWRGGPVEVTLSGGEARLTNRIEREIAVRGLMVYEARGMGQEAPVNRNLLPSESVAVPVPGTPAEAHAVYTFPAAAPGTLQEVRSFVEEIQTNVIFVDLIHHASHGLTRLDIAAQIEGIPGTQPVPLSGSPASGSVDFLLPLTAYLEKHILQFQVTTTLDTGDVSVTPWVNWDLQTQGNIVSLVWEMIQQRHE